jgi:hypothetical protein
MLRVISDLTLCDRFDREYEAGVATSGVAGMWVTLNASNKFDLTSTDETGLSYQIWNESNRDGTAGFTPDTGATGKVSVLKGSYRAQTDQIDATAYTNSSVGNAVMADDGGQLILSTDDATGSESTVGFIARKLGSVTYLGTTYTNVVEIHVNN